MTFDDCYRLLMNLEGVDLSDHRMDPGGKTKFGISELGYPNEDIAGMTVERAKELYRRDYWLCLKLDDVKDDVRFELFEAAVNLDPPGFPRRAVMIAQGALILFGQELVLDGVIGPKTIAALNQYPYRQPLLKLMNGLQLAVLLVGLNGEREFIDLVKVRLATHKTFLRGWLRRIEL
jgi:lysozyme family protein